MVPEAPNSKQCSVLPWGITIDVTISLEFSDFSAICVPAGETKVKVASAPTYLPSRITIHAEAVKAPL